MTKEEIIEMAKQAKLPHDYVGGGLMWLDKLEHFAKLVAKKALETKEGLLDRKSYLLGLYDQKSRLGLETKDEPVAWEQFHEHMAGPNYVAPQRTWVGLTDEEIAEVEDEYIIDYRIPAGSAWNFAKDIEAKLKEKNE